MERSICAIPLKEGYVYDYSTTTKSWDQEGIYTDPDIYLGITTLDHTTRHFEFAHGYGNSMRKTRYAVEILDLFKNDIKVEYYWDPFDDETFYLRQRSMILIPFF